MDKLFDLTTLDNHYDMQEVMTHVGEVIKVIGVGGGGCNAIDNMVRSGVKNVEFICANTDAKALSRNKAHHLLQLGHGLTRGLGAGSQPEVGKKAAMEDREKIAALLKGTDMLFIASGMGGGTGTGAAPVIADIARSLNILTVGVVTKPFSYEGDKRKKIAEAGIAELKKYVDSLIVLPNEKLLSELDEEISMRAAFAAADDVLKGAVLGITEVIKTPGVISLDFADVKTVMSGRGLAMMGSSSSCNGPDRASDAAEKAIFSPLLDDVSLDGAKGVLVNISSAPGALRMKEYHEILGLIQNHVHPEADFKAGMAEIENLPEEEIRVTVIATGLSDVRNSDTALFTKEDNENDISSAAATSTDTITDPFGANFNKAAFSTPSFFRRNRS
ncbi:MAG: cell division protein FtsZ [Burkholderiales bacterium]|nr:cell division protein FtsZ [Burkholderiales bacterium]